MTTTDIPRQGPLLTKLRPPVVRDQTVVRQRLLAVLRDRSPAKLTVVAAPAGCGKSTLLASWHDIDAPHRSIAWVTIDERDNDPVVLWLHIVEALTRSCAGMGAVASSALDARASLQDVVLPLLVNELTTEDDVVLVLDDFHRLSSVAARSGVNWLIDHAPECLRVVVASRTEPALNLSGRRARGQLQEIRASDLGFTADEAEALLNERLELELERPDIEDLVARTEGWPAGLYLAALSLRGVQDRHAFMGRFGGTTRPVVDFLVDEVLDTYDPELQKLMVRCSVLDRLSGPLCDAVLDDEGTGDVLRSLSRSNLFLRPLDDEDEGYRFHRVFAQLLRVELEHREPGLATTLHRRACAWYREHGFVCEAIDQAFEADDFDTARELIAGAWATYANAGRHETVLAWLERFPAARKGQDAELLAAEAWALSLSGRRESLGAIAQAEALGSVEGSVATLRGFFPWGDVGAGLAEATRAHELEGPNASVCWALAIGHHFSGDTGDADRWFTAAADLAPRTDQWVVAASALAYRSLIAGQQGRPEAQSLLADEAALLVREHGVEGVAGEVHLAAAVAQLARGEAAAAWSLAQRGVAAQRALAQPTTLAYALILEGRMLRELGDRAGADAAAAEARAIVETCADPGVLSQWVAEIEAPRRRRSAPAPELSPRERSILRFLTGTLSERDIGRELYLSHNTIHSHTRSIYRKLGVSSRAEAIAHARATGLL